MKLSSLLPITTVYAHCDLPCGVYDPAQARIEAASIYGVIKKADASTDEAFKTRALIISEDRAEAVKHHLWVLWTDYFKPEHLETFPTLHDTFWKAAKAAGEVKHAPTLTNAETLLELIDAVGHMFEASKPGYDYAAVVKNTNPQIGR